MNAALSPTAQAAHALFSASGSDGWMACAAKLAAERGASDSPSRYAAEGTVAHTIGARCLAEETDARLYLGEKFVEDGFEFTVDEDMADYVQKGYVDVIRQRIKDFELRGAVSVQMLVEVRVDYSRYIGQPDSFGTSDVVLLVEWPNDVWQIDVGDLKYGMGVPVYASYAKDCFDQTGAHVYPVNAPRRGNRQMMLYALGALDQYSMLCEATIFSMAIYQPRIHHFDEWECDLGTLIEFADQAKAAAERAVIWLAQDTIPISAFTPGEKQCRWCKVGGSCKARAAKNLAVMAQDFVDLDACNASVPMQSDMLKGTTLGADALLRVAEDSLLDALYPNLDEFDNWVKAVRGEIEKRALSGTVFTTCKVVQGKRGNRAWTDETKAEEALKGFRLKVDQMYTFKLISPTNAEKLLGDQPKRWSKLLAMIGQAEGKLSVADITDKRPAVVIEPPSADDFDVVDDLSDLA